MHPDNELQVTRLYVFYIDMTMDCVVGLLFEQQLKLLTTATIHS